MKRIRTGLFASATAVAVALGASSFDAQAQTARDVNDLSTRLDRLQRDMDTLQRSVYQGRPVPPPASGAGLPADARFQADMSVRIDQLESRLAAVNGRAEEIEHQLALMRDKLDKMAADLDARRTAAAPPGGSAPLPAQTPTPMQSAAAQPAPLATGGEGAGPGAPPRSLGTIPAGSVPPGPPPEAPPPQSAPRAGAASTATATGDGGTPLATLPPGSPKQQYDYATSLLMNKQDYAAAETALKAFVAAHPKDPLAGSAQYWVGETYFARKDYQNAAFAYADGVEKYPQSPKAPDSLLKLGMSLARLGKNDQACTALSRLQTAFPSANDQVKRRATDERTRIKCKA
jgi:tol-pal system protein YbgF